MNTAALTTPIVPVQVYPETADLLVLQPGQFGPPPWYLWTLTNSSGKRLAFATVQMNENAWNAWPAGLGPDGDANYQLDAICKQLNLTRV